MRRAFALEVLHQLPESARQHAAERLAEIAEHSITPTINALEKLSTDARLEMRSSCLRARPYRHHLVGGIGEFID